jgi:hypothetical protein
MAAHSVARTSLPTLTVVEVRVSGLAEPAAPQAWGWEQIWQQRVEAAVAIVHDSIVFDDTDRPRHGSTSARAGSTFNARARRTVVTASFFSIITPSPENAPKYKLAPVGGLVELNTSSLCVHFLYRGERYDRSGKTINRSFWKS